MEGITAVNAFVNGYSELGFNCYEAKSSQGNPVLRDPRFRRALQWAIDKESITATAFFGNARPASTIIPSGYYPDDTDYHWEPPADVAYTFDPEKAKSMLDEAGLRRQRRRRAAQRPRERRQRQAAPLRAQPVHAGAERRRADQRLARGRRSGHQLRSPRPGSAHRQDVHFDAAGDFAPDYDLFIWYWHSDPDPDWVLGVLTSSQIENWSDSNWSNAEYDRLYEEQQAQIDPAARLDIIHRMQQIIYDESPYIPLVYLEWLQAYDSADWTDWVRAPTDTGGVTRNIYNIDSYVQVQPAVAAETTDEGGSSASI